MINFLKTLATGSKKVTHAMAIAVLCVYGFSQTDAGKALVKQYPYLSTIVEISALISIVYHKPDKPNKPNSD